MYELSTKDTALIRQASDSELPALVTRLARNLAVQTQSDPLEMRDYVAELALQIKECRCGDLPCAHNCNSCTPDACEFESRPYWCEDCFAFVPDYPTFCHCGATDHRHVHEVTSQLIS